MNNDKNTKVNLVKIVAIVVMAVAAIAIIFNALGDSNTNYMGPGMMQRMHNGDQGISSTNTIPDFMRWIITLSVQLLGVLFFIGIIIAIVLLLKKYLGPTKSIAHAINKSETHYTKCPQCHSEILDEFKFCPVCSTKLTEVCGECHRPIQGSWHCCPYCGKVKDNPKETNKETNKKTNKETNNE